MPPSEFSEFTFGFGFTHEVVSTAWGGLTGAPEMPSLYDEGLGKGYDVAMGFVGYTYFAQFKRGFRAVRSTARHWTTTSALTTGSRSIRRASRHNTATFWIWLKHRGWTSWSTSRRPSIPPSR
jgi:hypothetical protein